MSRSSSSLVAPVLVVLAVLAGCSDSAQPAQPAPPSRPFAPENTVRPPSPQTWLAQVCAALAPAVRSATPIPPTNTADVAGTRDRVVAYLDDRIRGVTTAIRGVNAAGPAPLEGGGASTDAVLDGLNQRLGAIREARESLEAVPANATDTLFYGLQRARAVLVVPGPDALRDLAVPTPLTDEAAGVAECRALTTP
ncbi:hypothetical protein WCD74_10300 [Actinomycetospora sp. OC33-EN08]|uniref:Uncharacterized protein n=1 Tax=Actinomycetospora aurantiaca TaxID=3129233 RepID=A0ABU8MLG8_9PSEU